MGYTFIGFELSDKRRVYRLQKPFMREGIAGLGVSGASSPVEGVLLSRT